MSDRSEIGLDAQLRRYAQQFDYPATPDLLASPAARSLRGRWAWAIVVVLLLAALVAVPPVRAYLADWLQIGSVLIEQPTGQAELPDDHLLVPVYPLDDLSGETTLEAARDAVEFPIALPAGWGLPERVFVQTVDADRHFVILVWGEQDSTELVLYVIGPDVRIVKGPPETVRDVDINNHPGAYLEGSHMLIVNGFTQFGVLVAGPALVWEGEEGLTYRLEAALSLDDMVRIAKTIQ